MTKLKDCEPGWIVKTKRISGLFLITECNEDCDKECVVDQFARCNEYIPVMDVAYLLKPRCLVREMPVKIVSKKFVPFMRDMASVWPDWK
jgi:hypothetical protein